MFDQFFERSHALIRQRLLRLQDYPVLWVSDSRRVAPFGEMVRMGMGG